MKHEPLILPHGGYRKLKSFQLAQLVYDITVVFCNRYIDPKSRTTDQMVQAARSGVQNIAEGSQTSSTSKKSEIFLTNVARASLEELKLDYEDYLRQRGMELLMPDAPVLLRFKELRCHSLMKFRDWIQAEHALNTQNLSDFLAANGALSVINICCYLLDKQIHKLANTFEKEGGFRERMYRVRKQNKSTQTNTDQH